MKLFTLAQSVQPFLEKKGEVVESIYKNLMTNPHLSFLKNLVPAKDFPILVFCAYEINSGNNNPNILEEIRNNLFYFSFIDFGDSVNDVSCEECSGDAAIQCDSCYGAGSNPCHNCDESGMVTCEECEGTKKQDCGDCDGTGELEDGETCGECNGSGQIDCDECNGSGEVECPECDGSGEIHCDDCDGRGSTTCDYCDGSGEQTIEDSIPYDIEIYASYDKKLKDLVEIHILRHAEYDSRIDIHSKTLLLQIESVDVTDNTTSEVSYQYENKEYFGGMVESSESDISYTTNKVYVSNLVELPDVFFQ